MIAILFDKNDKKTAVNISKILQSKGYKTTFEQINKNNPQQFRTLEHVILIFSQKSNHSEFLINQFDTAYENGINVIPFIISDVELSITMQHFLNTHDWINAFDVSQKEAANDLVTLIKELSSEPQQQSSIIQKQTKTEKSTLTKKQKQTYSAIGVGLLFMAIIGIFWLKNNASATTNPDKLIVGNWKLAKYEDNMQRSPQEFADFQAGVQQLQRNFLLKLKEDGTFEKYGFSTPETGNWQFDPQNKILYMWPPNADKQRDMLKVEKLTQDTLIMIIATQIDSLTLINTKFTLYKE